jgi:hypothetical protein
VQGVRDKSALVGKLSSGTRRWGWVQAGRDEAATRYESTEALGKPIGDRKLVRVVAN